MYMLVAVIPYNTGKRRNPLVTVQYLTRMSRVYVLFLCFAVVVHHVTGNLIRNTVDSPVISTKDDNVEKNAVDLPIDTVMITKQDKECVKIGQFVRIFYA